MLDLKGFLVDRACCNDHAVNLTLRVSSHLSITPWMLQYCIHTHITHSQDKQDEMLSGSLPVTIRVSDNAIVLHVAHGQLHVS